MTSKKKIIYKSDTLSFSEIETVRGKRVILDMGRDAVLIVPRMTNGDYVVITQVRVGRNSETYEFPSGGIKNGETPEDAAIRELLEETGSSGKMTFIKTVEPLSGLVKFNVHIFRADIRYISEQNKSLDEHEEVNTILLSEKELLEKIRSLEVVDSYLLLGLAAVSLAAKD